MLKDNWTEPAMDVEQLDVVPLQEARAMSDAELKLLLEEVGYLFQKRYQASKSYIYRKIADTDVLISIGENIANFNGYIQLNKSAAAFWEQLSEPSTLSDLEQVLERRYGIPHEQAVKDVLEFLNMLREHDMVMTE